MQVLYLDPKENPGALDFFGVKAEDAPIVVVHAPQSNSKYSSGTVDVSKVVSWIADFKAGKVEKIVKSEEIPASQDGPVTVVVGKSFDSVVRSGKNVFIEFYAPWYAPFDKCDFSVSYEAIKSSHSYYFYHMPDIACICMNRSFSFEPLMT